MVKAVMEEDLGLNQVVLPKKYSNFSNVFDKVWVNILPQHNQHSLVIELETN